jgi:hypothetical protein
VIAPKGILVKSYLFCTCINANVQKCVSSNLLVVNFNPGGYIKRTKTAGIRFIFTSVSEKRVVGNGHICVDFIYMN